jgi:uncharacterized protein
MRATTAECAACLLQFAKAPVAGRVKSRFMPDFSAEQAAAIARTLTERVAAALSDAPPGWRVALAADDPSDPFLTQLAAFHGRALIAQGAGDLGRRMARASAAALERYQAVIIVGSDCLDYDPAYLRAASDVLSSGQDAVLGPATDGGYVLIGLRRFDERLFDGIAWGGPEVLAAQRKQLSALGFRWQELPPRDDLDTPEDVHRCIHAGKLPADWVARN